MMSILGDIYYIRILLELLLILLRPLLINRDNLKIHRLAPDH
jgi:hypothetical protein